MPTPLPVRTTMGHNTNQLLLIQGVLLLLLLPAAALGQNLQLADSLNTRGMEFYESGQYRQAEFYLREAYTLYRQSDDPEQWLVPGIDYAEILVDRARYDEGIELLQQLQTTAEEQQNVAARARIQNDLGWAYNIIDKNDQALNHLEQAIPLARQARDTLRLGYIHNNLGLIYRSRGEYDKAIAYFEESLPFKKRAGSSKSVGITLANMGNIYRRLSLYDEALNYYNRSLQIYKELNNRDLQAAAYLDIANIFNDLGQYDEALENYQQSLKHQREAGDPAGMASVLNDLGTLYSELGQNKKALGYYRESLAIKKDIGGPSRLATGYKNVGSGLWRAGREKEAVEHYQKALELRRRTGDPRKTALSLIDLTEVELTRKAYASAKRYVAEANILADSMNNRSLMRSAALWEGHIAAAQGQTGKAINHYKTALAYARPLRDNARLVPLKSLAHTFNTAGSDSALWYGQRAIDLIEEERSQTGRLLEHKAGYFKQHADFYIDMAAWKLQYRDDTARAYQLAELAKARVLSDELAEAARRVDETLPEKVRLRRAQYLADISGLYERMRHLPPGQQAELMNEQIREKELSYAAFENGLEEKYDRYKSLKSPDPVSLEDVQQMHDSETAILEYAVSDAQVLVFYISRNTTAAHRVAVGQTDTAAAELDLGQQVAGFREAILTRAPEDSIHRLAKPLYTQLISPFEPYLSGKQNLLIVPDGYLAYLPFEALRSGHSYMVSEYNIKYAPSMTGFSLISPPRETKNHNVLTIANADRYRTTDQTPMLPTVNMEVESISELFDNATILRNQQINEQNVKARLQEQYSLIHIAAHSMINEQNASQSGIILAESDSEVETGIGNDGYLRSSEIYRLNIPSSMVVLSACESGIGQMIDGEGMLGLQRAFFTAGTSTVVVSLWDVYDRSTTRFMQLFYGALTSEDDNQSWADSWNSLLRWTGWDESLPFGKASSSMRIAKLAMLDHPRYRHPVYWAPFIVVGR